VVERRAGIHFIDAWSRQAYTSVAVGIRVNQNWQSDIALMAADPQIQAELRAIEQEFAAAEADGLERISPSEI